MANLAHWRRSLKDDVRNESALGESLSSATVDNLCRRAGHCWRKSFWNPRVTLLTFLLQVLDGAKSLRSAVSLLLVHLADRGEADLPSCDPSAFCQARQRLPCAVVHGAMVAVANRTHALVDAETGWHGHPVYLVDGSNVSMPDTAALQKEFPQSKRQKPGCGFPMAQFVAVFCWTTGAILKIAIDTIRPHELTLFRRLWDWFEAGSIVVADRAYGAYVDMACLYQKGVFCVFRLHQRRKADFRSGTPLGPDDRLVAWEKPKRWWRSCGLDRDAFAQLPETLAVRLIRITNCPKGFRSHTIIVATTLLDPIEFPADEIRALYRDRWTAELNLRSLKIALDMDVLRGESPDVVRKEIAMHLLAYNLIRFLMWQAARAHGRNLHRLSFTGTLHRLRHMLPLLLIQAQCQNAKSSALLGQLLAWIAHDAVPHRPDRYEPRRVKRRAKQYTYIVKPRAEYKNHAATGVG